jgi:hypothetical protein
MITKNDEVFELVCLNPENIHAESEFSLGLYSSQEIANEQKDICEKQAEKENYYFEYQIRKRRIIL